MRFILTYLLLTLTLSAQTIQKFSKGVNIGERSFFTETQSGKEPIWGVNAAADVAVANRVNATHTDGFGFIRASYVDGVQLYATESGAVVGNQINLPAHRRLWVAGGESVVWGPWTGETNFNHTINYRTGLLNGTITKAAGHNMATSTAVGTLGPLNFEGSGDILHGPNYTATPRYANTLQVYTFPGMIGTVIGSNSFTGNLVSSSGFTGAEEPNGNIRLELGPVSPYSEKLILVNDGTLLMGRTLVRKHTASQAGAGLVTATSGTFLAGDVGRAYLSWGDFENGGKVSSVDRITGFTSGTQVTTERARTIASQGANVVDYKIQMSQAGDIYSQTMSAVTSLTTASVLIGTPAVNSQALVQAGASLSVGSGFGGVIVPGLNISNTATPASATATGTAGDIAWDANFIYVCISTDVWKRVAISTW